YVHSCRRILEQVDEAERTARGEYTTPRGEIVITAPIVFGRLHITPLITEFLDTYPDISVRMQLTDRIVHLMEEHIDIALRIGKLADSSMVATAVGEVARQYCASPNYLDVHGRPMRPKDLAQHQCVAFGMPHEHHMWPFMG